MDMEGVLAITFIFGGGTCSSCRSARSARRWRSGSGTTAAAPTPDPELLAEVDALRAEVSELHERVDFAERLLAQRQEPGKIGAGE